MFMNTEEHNDSHQGKCLPLFFSSIFKRIFFSQNYENDENESEIALNESVQTSNFSHIFSN
jgi:hypothetical protein